MSSAAAFAGLPSLAPRAEASEGAIESITVALPSIPDTLFVPHAWNTYTGAIMSLVQEGLLGFGGDFSLQPALAEAWERVDPTTVRYRIRKGVRFGDGSLLTASDAVASFNWHLNPKSGSQLAPFFSSIASVEESASEEVTVRLKAPNVQFAYTPAHMAGFVFNKGQLADKAIGTPELLPLGTGPYRLVEFVPTDRVVVEARSDYWGPKPVVQRIVFQSIPDRQARRLAMQGGEIDGAFDLSISDIDQWKALGNVDVITAPSLGVFVLTLDHSAPPFDDINVRRAVAHSVDRDGLVAALLKGNGESAKALNPPEMWSGVLTPEEVRAFYSSLPDYPFDLAEAKAALARSSHPNGFDVQIPVPTSDPYMINIMQSLVENLKQLGVNATIRETDNNTWLARYFRHEDLGMQIMAYFPDYADAANYPSLFFSSATAVTDGMNGSNFKNTEVDTALKAANEQFDPKIRAKVLKRVFEIVNDDVAIVPIFWPYSAMALNRKYKFTGYSAFWYNIPWAMRGFGVN